MDNPFITRNADKIIGVLSGFDRLVIRGTLRLLAVTSGMMYFLTRQGIRLTQFRDYVKTTSERLKEASLREAEQRGRPVRYLNSGALDKEAIARAISTCCWRISNCLNSFDRGPPAAKKLPVSISSIGDIVSTANVGVSSSPIML